MLFRLSELRFKVARYQVLAVILALVVLAALAIATGTDWVEGNW